MHMSTWRNVSKMRNAFLLSPRLVSFHSTPASFAKWKRKFDYDKDENRSGQQSKNYARYVVRRKRADAKRALNDFLLKGVQSTQSVQEEWATWYPNNNRSTHSKVDDFSVDFCNQARPEHAGRCKPQGKSSKKTGQNVHGSSPRKGKKKWSFVKDDSDDNSETTFEAHFGDKCYTWSYRTWDGFGFRSSNPGFEWRDDSNWSKNGKGSWGTKGNEQSSSWTDNKRAWERESDFEDNDNEDVRSSTIGSSSHRATLGLPPTGPLQIDEVKTAFRASALKWHPDRHQGPSQAMAGEKFKSCVEAYKSLCHALGPA